MSELKVNKVSPQSGTTVTVGDSGDTVSVDADKVEVNKIIPVTGTTLTVGDSGDTVSVDADKIEVNKIIPVSGTDTTFGDSSDNLLIPSGAKIKVESSGEIKVLSGGDITVDSGATITNNGTAVGLGRTGTVDWCTAAKTGPLTAVTGKGYFINTTSGGITVTLPTSPSAGDIVAMKDYAETWDTNSVTVGRAGSKINGQCNDATLETEAQSVTMIYVDGTKGWQDIHDSTANVTGASFICATGGDAVVTCGNYKTHIFTGAGCFAVASLSSTPANNAVEYLVTGGGGGAGRGYSGGGGGGGFRYFSATNTCGSPLVGPAGITVTASTYPIAVGAAGTGQTPPGGSRTQGGSSIFDTITSAGGGYGGTYTGPGDDAGDGASGGGGGNPGSHSPSPGPGGTGNTPPTSPPQGTNGGLGIARSNTTAPNHRQGGGGGGAQIAGTNATDTTYGGDGGAGSQILDGFIGPTAPSYGSPGPVSSTRYFGGGGGGGITIADPGPNQGGDGGVGGGGGGGNSNAVSGTTNTGGGGGGGSPNPSPPGPAGDGGSGVVMLRYLYQ